MSRTSHPFKQKFNAALIKLSSKVAHQKVQLLIQVCLKVKALKVAFFDATFFLRLEVHLVVALDALVRACGDHGGQVFKDHARLQVFNKVAFL